MIAFFEECVIYQCKFWNYKQNKVNPATGEADMIISNGTEELKIKIGKDQKGKRAMQIGDKNVVYSMITSRFMPSYPNKDTRADFVDNGYNEDTITVIGW